MRILLGVLCLFFISAQAATEENSFEKSLQNFGKKLDEAKAKGEKLGTEVKKEWKEIQSKTDQATGQLADQIADKTEAKGKDWTTRVKGAFNELSTGVKNAWNKLNGDS